MKRRLKLLALVPVFILGIFATKTTANSATIQDEAGLDIMVKCHCTMLGKCKASGSGNTCGGGDNFNCQDLNGNC